MIPATKIPSLKAPREFHFGRISKNLRTSFFWAWLDTICRYRRSRIGPLWETINVFVMVIGVTLVSSSIMGGRDILSSMPYVGLGIICWSAISSIINSASKTFIRHAGQIRCSSMSIDLYVGRVVFGSLITFCHHCLLYIIGLLLLPYAFPDSHWRKIRTNNPLERIMKEIRRRTGVVGAFPDGQS